MTPPPPILACQAVVKTFRRETGEIVRALDGVNVEVGHGTLAALVGPDGAGKTTLLRLAAGLMTADSGDVAVLGMDIRRDAASVQARIGYMPQRFGLYDDLSVQENLDLYADMHGVTGPPRRQRYERLLHMTALGPFTRRLAGKLSGGMKQKLGLACTLIRQPELLLLDEPTVGVDPLSRRELWEIITDLVHGQGVSVVVSTTYLDEAPRAGMAIVMHQGKVLACGPPDEVCHIATGRVFRVRPASGQAARGLQARLLDAPGIVDAVPEAGLVRIVTVDTTPPTLAELEPPTSTRETFRDGFMVLMQSTQTQADEGLDQGFHQPATAPTAFSLQPTASPVVSVRGLVRRFGDFTAVDHVDFQVRRGEVFGLLGPNGAGKTTTFRMLCGLLPASGGELTVAGVDLHKTRASARQRIGYVAQKYSLYGQLSVVENLGFFASAYGLRGSRRRGRIEWAIREFGLADFARLTSEKLPGGYKQRLAMAAALLHEPEILFLDEPTSGADPLARRDFWRRITALAEGGVTVIVTTHFMEEAEYCDRIAIIDAGKIWAQDTPANLRQRARRDDQPEPTMEEAFLEIVEAARRGNP
ncbi:MAG: ATP-binding cassette domain-containing protein [Phycisphaerae bacterium]|nr:ATP-binding cassette domain-containing protein [Phycisphaerae bacterium]